MCGVFTVLELGRGGGRLESDAVNRSIYISMCVYVAP